MATRTCSVCKLDMYEGFYLAGDYACSSGCRDQWLTANNLTWEEVYDEDGDEFYYTDWQDVDDDDEPLPTAETDKMKALKYAFEDLVSVYTNGTQDLEPSDLAKTALVLVSAFPELAVKCPEALSELHEFFDE